MLGLRLQMDCKLARMVTFWYLLWHICFMLINRYLIRSFQGSLCPLGKTSWILIKQMLITCLLILLSSVFSCMLVWHYVLSSTASFNSCLDLPYRYLVVWNVSQLFPSLPSCLWLACFSHSNRKQTANMFKWICVYTIRKDNCPYPRRNLPQMGHAWGSSHSSDLQSVWHVPGWSIHTLKPPLTWGFLLNVWLNGSSGNTDFLLVSIVEGFGQMGRHTFWRPKYHFMMLMAYTSLSFRMNVYWFPLLPKEGGVGFNNILMSNSSDHYYTKESYTQLMPRVAVNPEKPGK